jgi:phytoene dehydrogenase-like protein
VEAVMAKREGRVVIIGAGHNGLVAAFYLAKAGYAPLVLERREIVGGVAVTEEIHPGFRCPTVVHTAGPLLPDVMKDLQLDKHGLREIKGSRQVVALHPDGRVMRIYDDAQQTARELAMFSEKDATAYPAFRESMERISAAIQPILAITPPDIDSLKIEDYLNLGKLGLKFRNLEKKDAYRLLRWGPMPIADLVAEWFENELLRATVAARGIYASFAGPWSAGTSVGLLLQAAFGSDATSILGGPGALTQAIAKAAAASGAEIRTNAPVKHVRVKNGEASSVVLESGEEIAATAIVSNADPQQTFLKLVDATDLDPGFLGKVRAYRSRGCVAKLNLALSALPNFSAIKNGGTELAGRIHIGPDIDYLERAFDAAKYGEFSPSPYMDITIPSLTDPSLAPTGSHVMSIHVQYAPYRLKNRDWNSSRNDFADSVIKTLADYAPNIRDVILHRQVITPVDLENVYGLSGGHIFHGEHALDQLFAFRPLLGWAQYRTPIKGLYLCGSGTHPGGGITGAPGANASREIIKQLKDR